MKREGTSRLTGLLLIVVLSFSFVSAHAEGLLPSLSETVGIAMPSLGEALQRYPDSETENDDGSVTEIYTNVSEMDFSTFSVYLELQGAELADYHVDGSVLTAEIRFKESSFSLRYDSKSGEAKVIYPAGTFDERLKSAKTHFEAGLKMLEEGKEDEALTEILAIPQYNKYAPVVNLQQGNDNRAAVYRKAIFRTPGNTVVFGHYEQDNNTIYGPEEIEWIVLDYDEKKHKALLLSKYGLDAKPYDIKGNNNTWEGCTLRSWLNGEFFQSAFSAQEKAAILTTVVDNSASQGYNKWRQDKDGGNNTQDQIFLLSCAEAKRYLDATYDDNKNIRARVAPTAYAIANGAWTSSANRTADGDAAGWWWLRSPYGSNDAANVFANGLLDTSNVSRGVSGVVRPAFWIDLESEYFK